MRMLQARIPTLRPTPRQLEHGSESGIEFSMGGMGTGVRFGHVNRDDIEMAQDLDFASHLFGTKEAEDYSIFQLQADLFSGNAFGLDQYYHSMLPRGEGMDDINYR